MNFFQVDWLLLNWGKKHLLETVNTLVTEATSSVMAGPRMGAGASAGTAGGGLMGASSFTCVVLTSSAATLFSTGASISGLLYNEQDQRKQLFNEYFVN